MKKTIIILGVFAFRSSVSAQYPYIRIADVMVSPENQDDIASDYITGTVRYDSVSRTLILHNATINHYDSGDPYDDSNGNTISIEAHRGQTVNVELIGQNTIFGTQPLVLHSGSYNITGSGSLVLNGVLRGIRCELGVDAFRIRQGASVVIYIPYWPATGFEGSSPYQDYDLTVLSIDSGTLIVNADYCIQSIVGFQLNGSYIVSPEGAYYNPENKTLVTEDGPVRDYLEIRPGTVGIPTLETIEWQAWGVDGGIRIDNIPDNSSVEIINTIGQVIHQSVLYNTEVFVPIKRGIYVVRVNDYAVKVFVK